MAEELTEEQYRECAQRLRERQQQINDALVTARERAGTVHLDQQSTGRVSRGDALQQQAMAQANVRQYEARLRQIEQAVKRLESGDYGYCVACDEPINPARLLAWPEVPLCLQCQAEREG